MLNDTAPVSETAVDTDLKVSFFPPLSEQRQGWILRILRKEHVTTLADVGCGEGRLLRCLCNPSMFLTRHKAPSNERDAEIHQTTLEDDLLSRISQEENSDINIERLIGLDIDEACARKCARVTAPPTEESKSDFPRWTPLEVEIFNGSLVDYNEALANVECIVSTEVIEHLPPDVLPSFSSMLLGAYRPRLLLITTPSYTFNARFTAPGASNRFGYPDPTRRTARVFRHGDHKFEWTPSEFTSYCETEAQKWGYEVEVAGIGKATEKDPWGRDEELGWATQVAFFRRREDGLSSGGSKTIPQGLDIPEGGRQEHSLIERNRFDAHPHAGKHDPPQTIEAEIIKVMEGYYTESGWSIWDLWVEREISIPCGGHLHVLVEVIKSCHKIALEEIDKEPVTVWRVKFVGQKHQQMIAKTKDIYQHLWSGTADDDRKSQGNEDVQWEESNDAIQTCTDTPESKEGVKARFNFDEGNINWGRSASWGDAGSPTGGVN